MTAPVQYGLLVLWLINTATQSTKTSTWPFLAYEEIEKSPCAKNILRNLASISLSIKEED